MDDGDTTPDHVQPFMLDHGALRGRMVRLPHVINHIIGTHAYPDPIAALLAEALCLTSLLAGMLKFEGIFTLQVKGAGVVRSIVCDMTNQGVIRGTAGYDADALAAAVETDFKTLLGIGNGQPSYLAFTVDQATSEERTQGIVPLESHTLTACVRDYFQQSEQIDTSFVCHVAKDMNGHWDGAALMLQNLPQHGGHAAILASDEDWQRSLTLMHSVTKDEMLDAGLAVNQVLYRLFHEEQVRVFDPIAISFGCRCNMERIKGILDGLTKQEKDEYSEDGFIMVTCEFCSTAYRFAVEEL